MSTWNQRSSTHRQPVRCGSCGAMTTPFKNSDGTVFYSCPDHGRIFSEPVEGRFLQHHDEETTEIMPLPRDDLFSTPSNSPLECAEPGCKVDLDPHASFDCEEHWPGDFRCQRHSDEHLGSEVYHPEG